MDPDQTIHLISGLLSRQTTGNTQPNGKHITPRRKFSFLIFLDQVVHRRVAEVIYLVMSKNNKLTGVGVGTDNYMILWRCKQESLITPMRIRSRQRNNESEEKDQ